MIGLGPQMTDPRPNLQLGDAKCRIGDAKCRTSLEIGGRSREAELQAGYIIMMSTYQRFSIMMRT
eukprot:scaffold421308_cov64-Attheya_sp.AAC.3